MAINYPTSLDDGTSVPDQTDNVSAAEAADVNLISAMAKALEAKVGIDASTVVTSIDNHLTAGMNVYGAVGNKTTTSAAYEDSGVTMTVVVTKTSTVWLTLTIGRIVHGDANQVSNAIIYWSSGTEATSEITIQQGDYANDEHSAASQVVKTSVAAGSFTAKVQVKTGSTSAAMTNIALTAFVIPDSLA